MNFNDFKPDYAIHPGEILEEILKARGINNTELAEKCGISPITVNHIIDGKTLIPSAIANKLEKTIGVSASLWINLNTAYEQYK